MLLLQRVALPLSRAKPPAASCSPHLTAALRVPLLILGAISLAQTRSDEQLGELPQPTEILVFSGTYRHKDRRAIATAVIDGTIAAAQGGSHCRRLDATLLANGAHMLDALYIGYSLP
jgi:hypothetical protein